jgi:hypothetical protein
MSERPDVGLERLIQGLEQELLEATDEEFMVGARDLGMNPDMKGSAAFIGVKDSSVQLLAALRSAYAERLRARTDPETPDPAAPSKPNADA